jgi:hypothetical protein
MMRIPDSIKCDIATVVRSVDYLAPDPGGICVFRTLIGQLVLLRLHIPSCVAIGGVAVQIGPHPQYDL